MPWSWHLIHSHSLIVTGHYHSFARFKLFQSVHLFEGQERVLTRRHDLTMFPSKTKRIEECNNKTLLTAFPCCMPSYRLSFSECHKGQKLHVEGLIA